MDKSCDYGRILFDQIYTEFHSESEFGYTGKSNDLDPELTS